MIPLRMKSLQHKIKYPIPNEDRRLSKTSIKMVSRGHIFKSFLSYRNNRGKKKKGKKMSFSDAELEEKLKDAGRSLLGLPSSTDEILSLLDGIEELLMKVAQSPSKSVQDALYPVMSGLISDELLRHSDMDVKVSAVSCITEITRITAPDQPYGDDHMKEVFQVTVAAFEKLSQLTGRCYTKAIAILDVIAKVRACLLMLDLECDALVFEMFQHFLNHIRSDHPDTVFSSMQVIMTMVLEESEDIPLDIISLLLNSVKKENQNISPLSWKLGETVITNCAAAVEQYLPKAVKSLGSNVDDYAQIVASICQKATEDLKTKSASDAKDNLEAKGLASDIVVTRKTGQTADGTSKSTCNGAPSSRKDDNPSQIPKRHILIKHSRRADSTSFSDKTKSEPDSVQNPNSSAKTKEEGNPGRADSSGIGELNGSILIKETKAEIELDSVPTKRFQKKNSSKNPKGDSAADNLLLVRADNSENEPESLPKKRGRKPNSLMNPEEGYDHSWMWSERKTYGPTRSRKSREKGSVSSPSGNSVLKKANPPSTLENVAEPAGLQSELNETKGNPSSKDHSIPDETYRRRGVPKRKRATLNQEANPKSPSMVEGELLSAEVEEKTPKKEPEDAITVDEKEPENSTKLGLSVKTNDRTAVASADMDEKELDNSENLGLFAQINYKTAVTSAETEAKDPCNPEEKLLVSTVKVEAENVNEDTSVKSGHKRRKRVNNSADKDNSEGSGLKNTSFETGTKSPKGDGSHFGKCGKSILRKNRVIGKAEESQSLESWEPTVGSRIKVWWPMDKQFYKGVIASYDPCKNRHKVCYDDGEEETLNMDRQRWERITDEDEKTDLPIVDTSSAITPNLEKKSTNSGQRKQANDASSSKSNLQKRRQKTKSNQKSKVKKASQEEEEKEKADDSPESNLQRGGNGKARVDQERQAKRSGQAKQAKARSSSKSTPRGGKGKTKSDETEEKNSNKGKKAKAESSPKSTAQKVELKIRSGEGKQAEKSDGLNLEKAVSSSKSNPVKGKPKPKSSEGKQAGKSDELNPLKADSSLKGNPGKGKPKQKSDKGTQAEKSDEPNPVKADSSSIGKPKMGKRKRKLAEEKQAEKPDEPRAQADSSTKSCYPAKGIQKKKPDGEKRAEKSDEPNPEKSDSSSESKQKLGKRKRQSAEEKQAEKPDEPKAQADTSLESNGIQKKKLDGDKQAEKADESKQAKADTSVERIIKLIRSGAKSVDTCPSENPATKDELLADETTMGERLKDDGQVSAEDLEAGELKTTSDCKKASPETLALFKGESLEADTGVDSEQCANKVVEMSKGEE